VNGRPPIPELWLLLLNLSASTCARLGKKHPSRFFGALIGTSDADVGKELVPKVPRSFALTFVHRPR
jgi:hypothetical protein